MERDDAFDDREAAAHALARLVGHLRSDPSPVVLGLPRGGVPVAAVVARELDAPLDVLVVRKLGVPGHRELAMGAIASGGAMVLDRDLVARLRISSADIDATVTAEQAELERRERRYRGDRPPPAVAGRVVVVVDDGSATGSTMAAALAALRELGPARLVAALPVASLDAVVRLEEVADEVIVASTPEPFVAVGRWYRRFAQVSDDEVVSLLS